jgi:hypothetical protein
MKEKYIGIMLGIILLFMPVTAGAAINRGNIGDWNLRINANAGGTTYCYIGEKVDASDGIDQYDVCHPPFFPPGRAFIFCQEQSFPDPFTNLLYEYKHCLGMYKVFNFTSFYYPSGSTGAFVTLSWDKQLLQSSEYQHVYLTLNGQKLIDMKKTGTYIFWSNPYQLLEFKITCMNRVVSIIC